jgi:hypothetical protein
MATPLQNIQEFAPALPENLGLESLFDVNSLLGLNESSHPIVQQLQFLIIPLWIFLGGFLLIGLTGSGYIGFAFGAYMFIAAMETWGWIDANWYDTVFAWLFVNIDSNFIVGFMVYPVKELMSTFFELEPAETSKFTPMNEW